MSENKEQNEIKEYADGWITERKGTDVPIFLKFAFIVIAGGAIAYFLTYMNGETGHADRGVFVRMLNEATQSSNGLMYAIAGLGVVYALILVIFAFRKFHEE
ncbi:MAG: hypothetical protein IPM66_03880 [Acidobacteriota bacterium]|nr:MAG: hypothetical protein IPM66_03880 [Acidobacteriota bacterium]